ncbi:unnamed protein product [Allacma fusca]|uniref:Uncharacterized protein n=1 Tax=Allacma fusca TaxID=39272 RepID=A0A8J2KEM1_9HEXA|nr:unnamed protein product [Allacma fusca]
MGNLIAPTVLTPPNKASSQGMESHQKKKKKTPRRSNPFPRLLTITTKTKSFLPNLSPTLPEFDDQNTLRTRALVKDELMGEDAWTAWKSTFSLPRKSPDNHNKLKVS